MINRSIQPAMPVGDYVTYSITATRDVAVVSACKDVGCAGWRHGWETTVDERTDLGKGQAAYIRQKSGRTFTELHTAGLTVFRFSSGQRCFAEHRTKPDIFRKNNGDWRTNKYDRNGVFVAEAGTIRQYTRVADWVDDFADHQGKINDQIQKG